MNRDRLEGKWKQFSGSMRERWGRLTNDPLSVVVGNHDQFAGRYQEQHGITQDEGKRQLREFLRRNRKWESPVAEWEKTRGVTMGGLGKGAW